MDLDSDGFYAKASCEEGTDCNDGNPAVYPGAPEICNALDDDCNGLTDDHPACDRTCDNPEVLLQVTEVTPNPPGNSTWPDAVWVGDGWIVGWDWQIASPACREVLLQKIAADGTLVVGPVPVSGGLSENVWVEGARLAWTGQRLGVIWREAPLGADCSGFGPIRTWYTLFDAALNPLTNRILLGNCSPGDHGDSDIGWSGRRFGFFWQTLQELYFALGDADGAIFSGCGIVIDTFPSGSGTHWRNVPWSGDHFGYPYTRETDAMGSLHEIYLRRTADHFILPDPEPIRQTFEPAHSLTVSSVWADGEWGISWSDERDAPFFRWREIYFMRVSADGVKVDSPGDVRITCCNEDNTEGVRRGSSELAWTGEEYGLIYEEEGNLYLQRVSALGQPVDPPLLVTADGVRKANWPNLVWNGSEYAVFYQDGAEFPARILMRRVGCNCTDADSDQFSTCAGGDCNDDNPLIHPLAAEACLDGQDNNCDGAADCQDGTACPPGGGSSPGAVSGLSLGADKETLSWSSEPSADVYDLLTGDLGDLRANDDYSRSRCLAVRVAGTSHSDPAVPAAGEGLYYLVRGKTDPCLLGTWGSVLRDEAQLTCP